MANVGIGGDRWRGGDRGSSGISDVNDLVSGADLAADIRQRPGARDILVSGDWAGRGVGIGNGRDLAGRGDAAQGNESGEVLRDRGNIANSQHGDIGRWCDERRGL